MELKQKLTISFEIQISSNIISTGIEDYRLAKEYFLAKSHSS